MNIDEALQEMVANGGSNTDVSALKTKLNDSGTEGRQRFYNKFGNYSSVKSFDEFEQMFAPQQPMQQQPTQADNEEENKRLDDMSRQMRDNSKYMSFVSEARSERAKAEQEQGKGIVKDGYFAGLAEDEDKDGYSQNDYRAGVKKYEEHRAKVNETAKAVEDRIKALDNQIKTEGRDKADVERRIKEQTTPSGVWDALVRTSPLGQSIRGIQAIATKDPIIRAKQMLEEAHEMLTAPDKQQGGGFWRSVKNVFADPDTYALGIIGTTQAFRDKDYVEALEQKVVNDQPLTDEEETFYDALILKTGAEMLRAGDISTAYSAGSIAAQSVPFMAEFILTAGVAAGATKGVSTLAQRAFLKYLQRKVAQKATAKVGRSVSKEAVNRVAQSAAKRGVEKLAANRLVSTIGDMTVGAAARMPLMPSSYKTIIEDMTPTAMPDGTFKEGMSFGKAALDAYIEVMSESSGELFGIAKGATVGKLFNFLGQKLGNYSGVKMLDYVRLLGSIVSKGNNALKKAGFHGMLEETGEEIVGETCKYAASIDDEEGWKKFWSKDNFCEMLLGFAPMSVFGLGANAAQAGKVYARYNGSRQEAEEALMDYLGLSQNDAQEWLTFFDNATPDEFESRMDMVYEQAGKDRGYVAKAVTNYMMHKAQKDALSVAWTADEDVSEETQQAIADRTNDLTNRIAKKTNEIAMLDALSNNDASIRPKVEDFINNHEGLTAQRLYEIVSDPEANNDAASAALREEYKHAIAVDTIAAKVDEAVEDRANATNGRYVEVELSNGKFVNVIEGDHTSDDPNTALRFMDAEGNITDGTVGQISKVVTDKSYTDVQEEVRTREIEAYDFMQRSPKGTYVTMQHQDGTSTGDVFLVVDYSNNGVVLQGADGQQVQMPMEQASANFKPTFNVGDVLTEDENGSLVITSMHEDGTVGVTNYNPDGTAAAERTMDLQHIMELRNALEQQGLNVPTLQSEDGVQNVRDTFAEAEQMRDNEEDAADTVSQNIETETNENGQSYPTTAEGEPDFGAMDEQTTAGVLTSELGDRAEAAAFAQAKIAEAEKAQKEAEKMKVNSTSLQERKAQIAARNDARDKAQRDIQYWGNVLDRLNAPEEVETPSAEATESTEEEIKPIGKGVFGNIYDQFKGKVKEAFDFLLRRKSGDLIGVFHDDELGDIDLVWGSKEDNAGLEHIIDKHVGEGKDFSTVDEAQKTIADVIANGKKIKEKWDKVTFDLNGKRVVIRRNTRDKEGNVVDEKKNWVVTSFDNNIPKSEKVSSASTLATPESISEGRAVAPNESSTPRYTNEEEKGSGKEEKNSEKAEEKKETKEEREQRRLEERKQRILQEGTTFDEYFELVKVSEDMSAADIVANIQKIISRLREEGDNAKKFNGFAHNGKWAWNAGKQIEGYWQALQGVVSEETLREAANQLGVKTPADLVAYGEKMYKAEEQQVADSDKWFEDVKGKAEEEKVSEEEPRGYKKAERDFNEAKTSQEMFNAIEDYKSYGKEVPDEWWEKAFYKQARESAATLDDKQLQATKWHEDKLAQYEEEYKRARNEQKKKIAKANAVNERAILEAYKDELAARQAATTNAVAEHRAKQRDEILKRFEPFVNKGLVQVYTSVDEVPSAQAKAHIRNGNTVHAWYDVDNNVVCVYLPHINDAQQAEEMMWHEVVAHMGLRELAQKLTPSDKQAAEHLFDAVWNGMSDEARKVMTDYIRQSLPALWAKVKNRATTKLKMTGKSASAENVKAAMMDDKELQRAAADEYAAHLAERLANNEQLTEQEQSIVEKIFDALRKLIAKLAGVQNVALKDNDIVRLLVASRKNIEASHKEAEQDRNVVHSETPERQKEMNAQFDALQTAKEKEKLIAEWERQGVYVTEYAYIGLEEQRAKEFAEGRTIEDIDAEIDKAAKEHDEDEEQAKKAWNTMPREERRASQKKRTALLRYINALRQERDEKQKEQWRAADEAESTEKKQETNDLQKRFNVKALLKAKGQKDELGDPVYDALYFGAHIEPANKKGRYNLYLREKYHNGERYNPYWVSEHKDITEAEANKLLADMVKRYAPVAVEGESETEAENPKAKAEQTAEEKYLDHPDPSVVSDRALMMQINPQLPKMNEAVEKAQDELNAVLRKWRPLIEAESDPEKKRDLYNQRNAEADPLENKRDKLWRELEEAERAVRRTREYEAARARQWREEESREFEQWKKDLQTEPAEDKAKFNADDYASRDELHGVMQGMYHDADAKMGVVTDAHILVAAKQLYDSKQKGKVIATHNIKADKNDNYAGAKKGEVFKTKGSYPNWRSVLVSESRHTTRQTVDFGDMANRVAGVIEQQRAAWQAEKEEGERVGTFSDYIYDKYVAMRLPDGNIKYFQISELRKFLTAAKLIGGEELVYSSLEDSNTRPISALSKDGEVVVVGSKRPDNSKNIAGVIDLAEGGERFSVVTDKALIDRLERGEKSVGYRNVVLNADGTMGSPMANKLGKKGSKSVKTSAFEFGKWEQAEENPDMATDNGKINLIKSDGLGSVGSVDYNPYVHIRPTTLNRQFTQAWKRDNLVYIETNYPTSELNKEYKAPKAKLSVGRHDWNGGELILSRWDKPVRVVSWEEVADEWEKEYRESGVTFDIVPPKLLPILAKRGVAVLPPKKAAGKDAANAYEKWKADNQTPRNTTLDEVLFSIRVNHNTPYLLKRADGSFVDPETGERLGFDHRFMGTGEGAQVHGWGSYFSVKDIRAYAGDKSIKVMYKGELLADKIQWGAFLELTREGLNIAKAVESLERKAAQVKESFLPADRKEELTKQTLSAAEELKKLDQKQLDTDNDRHHYEVDIPDNDGTNYLEEDKIPTDEQMNRIYDGLKERRVPQEYIDSLKKGFHWKDNRNFRYVYHRLSDILLPTANNYKQASQFLSKLGFVGIHYNGLRDGECYVIFDENDAQIVAHERFSIGTHTFNNGKSLIGLHNIDSGSLRKALKTGGLANPSVAIIDIATQNHSKYGEISLILPSSMVDSRTGRNDGTYLGDAYTPTYPHVERQKGKDTPKRLDKLVEGLPQNLGRYIKQEIQSYMNGNTYYSGLEYLYLKERGEEVPIAHRERDYPHISTKEIAARLGKEGETDSQVLYEAYSKLEGKDLYDFNLWLNKNGDTAKIEDFTQRAESVDSGLIAILTKKYKEHLPFGSFDMLYYRIFSDERDAGTENLNQTLENAALEIDKRDLRKDFEAWKAKTIDSLGYEEVLFAGYTPSGYRRYLPNTVENASKLMNKEPKTNATNMTALGATRAMLADKLRTLDAIRKHRDMLRPKDEEIEKIYDEVSDEWYQLGRELADYAESKELRTNSNDFFELDSVLKKLQEAMQKSNPTDYLNKEYGYSLPADGEMAQRIKDMKARIKNLPTAYFETWFRRPVYLREFAAAVVPSDLSQDLKDSLSGSGLPLYEYEDNNEESRREATLKATEGESVRFSVSANTPTTPEDDEEYVEPELPVYDPKTMSILDYLDVLKAYNAERLKIEPDKQAELTRREMRNALLRQKKEIRDTVAILTKIANTMLADRGLGDVNKGAVQRTLAAIKNAATKRDLEEPMNTLYDIAIKRQLSQMKARFERIMKLPTKKVNSNKVSMAKAIDDKARVIIETFKNWYKAKEDDIKNKLNENTDKIANDADLSALARETMENENLALGMCLSYQAEVDMARQALREIRDAEREVEENPALAADDKAAQLAALAAQRRLMQENLVESYEHVCDVLANIYVNGHDDYIDEQKRIEDHKHEVLHYAFSDLQGIVPNTNAKQQNQIERMMDFILNPNRTFLTELKKWARYAPNGEGYLFNHFARGFIDARHTHITGLWDAQEKLAAACERILGKGMNFIKAVKATKKVVANANFKFGDNEGTMPLTIGKIMMIYAWNKQADGKVKLRAMEVSEADVEQWADMIPHEYIELMDWIQDEFLPKLRDKYNNTHRRVFGTQMAFVENYFPIKIAKEAIARKEDIESAEFDKFVSGVVGAIKNRSFNKNTLDVMNYDALTILADHIKDMEWFNAMSGIAQDLNTLIGNRTFNNKIDATLLGKASSRRLSRELGKILLGKYQDDSAGESVGSSLIKMVARSKISGRLWTAIKQLASFPAFLVDSAAVKTLIKDVADKPTLGVISVRWCFENLPMLKERFASRLAGNAQLDTSALDNWAFFRKVNELSQLGLLPNGAVDVYTCAIGAYAKYRGAKKRYLSYGLSEADAEKRAIQDAEIFYNETQQSSEGLFRSQMQASRTLFNVAMSAFQNAQFGYGRKFVDGCRQVVNALRYKQDMLAFAEKQWVRSGLTEEQAKKAAKRDYNRSLIQGIANIGMFGFAIQAAWYVFGHAPQLVGYIFGIGGDDDDEKADKDKAIEILMNDLKQAFTTPVIGLRGGAQLDAFWQAVINDTEFDLNAANKDILISDLVETVRKASKGLVTDDWAMFTNAVARFASSFTGTDIQTLYSIIEPVVELSVKDDIPAGEIYLDIMRILNMPNSQQKAIGFRHDPNRDIVRDYVDWKRKQRYGVFYHVFDQYYGKDSEGWDKLSKPRRQAIEQELENAKKELGMTESEIRQRNSGTWEENQAKRKAAGKK